MQRLTPHRFVHAPEFAQSERLVDKCSCECRVLELCTRAFHAVGNDARVIEGEGYGVVASDPGDREVVDGPKTGVGRVAPGDGRLTLCGESDVGDGHDSHAWVAVGSAIRSQLLDMSEGERPFAARD